MGTEKVTCLGSSPTFGLGRRARVFFFFLRQNVFVGSSVERRDVTLVGSVETEKRSICDRRLEINMGGLGDVFEEVGDERHLIRERALVRFRRDVVDKDVEDSDEVERQLWDLLHGERWEACVGGLMAVSVWVRGGKSDGKFRGMVRERAVELMSHEEVRVRDASGATLGVLAEVDGVMVWNEVAPRLLKSCEENFALDEETRQKVKMSAPTERNAQAKEMVHDTEGWRGLETSMIALKKVMEGCGEGLVGDAHLEAMIDLALRARTHPNRFVRETSMNVFTTVIVEFSRTEEGKSEVKKLIPRIAQSVARGLEDNWSQVRYVSSVCARNLLTSVDLSSEEKEIFYPLFVPRMCLNRHYVAEGVKLYSLESWKIVMGSEGKVWIGKCIEKVVQYLEEQSKADNHAVREAACQTFSEIATKLEESFIAPYVSRIIASLIDCFKDESWPVRDHACTACSQIVCKYPLVADSPDSRPGLSELYDLWIAHLADNIPSVRENSAMALSRVAKAFPVDHDLCGIERMIEDCKQLLPSVENQKRDSTRYGTLSQTGSTQFGAAHKLARDNDPELHTDQTLYSCGSLAPKLKRGGGCMDHGFSRHKEPWESTDGALRLWRRLTEIDSTRAGGPLLPLVESIAKLEGGGFAHAPYLFETLWTQLDAALPLLNPRDVVTSAPQLLPSIQASRRCGHAAAEVAAASAERTLQRILRTVKE